MTNDVLNFVTIGIVADSALGQFAADKIYDDLDEKTTDAIPETVPHRNVDITIANAHKAGKEFVVSTIVVTDFGVQDTSKPISHARL